MLPIVIPQNHTGAGYVYLAKFHYFENRYKIGSTGNPIKRLDSLRQKFGPTHFVIYGFSEKRLETERQLQWLLQEYNNRTFLQECINKNIPSVDIFKMGIIGGPLSIEHFVFNKNDIPTIEKLFNYFCTSTKSTGDRGFLL